MAPTRDFVVDRALQGLPPRHPPPARRPPGPVLPPLATMPAPQVPQGLLTEVGVTWLRAFLASQAPPQLPAPPPHPGQVTFPAALQAPWAQGLQLPLHGLLPGSQMW